MNDKPILYVQKGREEEMDINSYDDMDEKVSLAHIQGMYHFIGSLHKDKVTY